MTEYKSNDEDNRNKLYNQLITDYYPDSNFSTFLQFYNSIENIDAILKIHLIESIKHRIGTIQFFEKELIDQIERAVKEKSESEKQGFGSRNEATILLIRFETFLNSIYSLCDNIAYLGQQIHPGIKRGFNEQLKNYQRHLDLYSQYEDYLNIIKSCDWYEDLHTMRSESTHYLPGFVYHPNNGKLGILYRNIVVSKKRIEIEDISEYIHKIVKQVYKFLDNFGEYMVNKYLTDKSETAFFCMIQKTEPDGKVIFMPALRMVTYDEYKEKEVGRCVDKEVPCPNKEFCPAYKF